MQPVHSDNPSILLASGSPRRHELTLRIGFDPVVRVSDIPEVRDSKESPREYARRLAAQKASAVADSVRGDEDLPGWILSADTIVVHDHQVLEKPADADEARQMLRQISGERHQVITAFCWMWRAPNQSDEKRIQTVVDVSAEVWLRELTDETIARYVATGEPMDKAGSYGIQDVGGALVRRLDGSYFAIVGLPVCEVVETLEELGGLVDYPFVQDSNRAKLAEERR